ncbi:hypothetical protein L873DRAFT_1788527 [Choiromyces venosus 120613-1]|uniref:GPI anchored protein n=1 Tax=Choiromyces venosus 120613-1 TaxID=1336337 RepID=A0A3N4JSS1_9PEZI|nr:hypothetical protein L873DRAFT_1788527 [Choiromyces venosus 120613-1]
MTTRFVILALTAVSSAFDLESRYSTPLSASGLDQVPSIQTAAPYQDGVFGNLVGDLESAAASGIRGAESSIGRSIASKETSFLGIGNLGPTGKTKVEEAASSTVTSTAAPIHSTIGTPAAFSGYTSSASAFPSSGLKSSSSPSATTPASATATGSGTSISRAGANMTGGAAGSHTPGENSTVSIEEEEKASNAAISDPSNKMLTFMVSLGLFLALGLGVM